MIVAFHLLLQTTNSRIMKLRCLSQTALQDTETIKYTKNNNQRQSTKNETNTLKGFELISTYVTNMCVASRLIWRFTEEREDKEGRDCEKLEVSPRRRKHLSSSSISL